MAFELIANKASTTLNNGGSVNNSSNPVTFVVTAATAFPATGNFRVLIDNEILKVTAVSGTSFTAARAQEGTTIATHVDGSVVTLILTAASLQQLLADRNMTGTFSSRPAAGVIGRRYQCTDTPFWYYDNGSTWDKFFGSYPIVTPDDTGFSWDNQNSCVLTTTKDMINISGGSSSGITLRYKTAPSAPWTAEVGILWNPTCIEAGIVGMAVRQASNGKIVSYYYENNTNTLAVSTLKFTTSTVFSGSYILQQKGPSFPNQPLFLRIVDDNTNLTFSASSDGQNWGAFDQRARTDFLTPNQIAFLFSGGGNGNVSFIHQKGW